MAVERREYRHGDSDPNRRRAIRVAVGSIAAMYAGIIGYKVLSDDPIQGDELPELPQRASEINAVVKEMEQELPEGARKVQSLLHPQARQLITVFRSHHLEVTQGNPEESPIVMAVQNDIESIILDVQKRFGLSTVALEGLDDRGVDHTVESCKADLLMMNNIGIVDSNTYERFVNEYAVILQDPNGDILNSALYLAALKRMQKGVEEAGSFEAWSQRVIRDAHDMALRYSGTRRLNKEGKITVLPAESTELIKRITLAEQQGASKDVLHQMKYEDREDHALRVAIESNEPHCGITFGADHVWTNNVGEHNRRHPKRAVSLAVISPQSLEPTTRFSSKSLGLQIPSVDRTLVERAVCRLPQLAHHAQT